jgi:hypothetical protein
MNVLRTAAIALAALLACAAGPAFAQAQAHIGHVMTGWGDTPGGRGLLPTAEAEAGIARQHAGLALSDPGDLDSIKLHTGHVLHAVDPSAIDAGPGLGYGLEKAAAGVATHIGLAAGSADASDNVKLHAEHVAASARNVVIWSREIVALADEIAASSDAAEAATMAQEVRALLGCIVDGCDADHDGAISWGPGEGGLAQARQHMGLMMEGEGMQ